MFIEINNTPALQDAGVFYVCSMVALQLGKC